MPENGRKQNCNEPKGQKFKHFIILVYFLPSVAYFSCFLLIFFWIFSFWLTSRTVAFLYFSALLCPKFEEILDFFRFFSFCIAASAVACILGPKVDQQPSIPVGFSAYFYPPICFLEFSDELNPPHCSQHFPNPFLPFELIPASISTRSPKESHATKTKHR